MAQQGPRGGAAAEPKQQNEAKGTWKAAAAAVHRSKGSPIHSQRATKIHYSLHMVAPEAEVVP